MIGLWVWLVRDFNFIHYSLLIASNLLWNCWDEKQKFVHPLALIKSQMILELNMYWFKFSYSLAVWTCADHFTRSVSLSLYFLICKIEIIMHLFLGCCRCKENLHLYGTIYNNRYIINDYYYYITLWGKKNPAEDFGNFFWSLSSQLSQLWVFTHLDIKYYLCTYMHAHFFNK